MRLTQDIANTMNSYHEFPGAAHGLSIDSDPEGYEKMVLEFLKKVYGA